MSVSSIDNHSRVTVYKVYTLKYTLSTTHPQSTTTTLHNYNSPQLQLQLSTIHYNHPINSLGDLRVLHVAAQQPHRKRRIALHLNLLGRVTQRRKHHREDALAELGDVPAKRLGDLAQAADRQTAFRRIPFRCLQRV